MSGSKPPIGCLGIAMLVVGLLVSAGCATGVPTRHAGAGGARRPDDADAGPRILWKGSGSDPARERERGTTVADGARGGPGPSKDGISIQLEKGALDQSDVDRALDEHLPRLKECYTRAGGAQKFVSGQIKLRFLVSPEGGVSDILVVENSLGNYAVERCLVVEGRQIAFAAPNGKKNVEFDYPLQFVSTGERVVADWDAGVFAKDVAEQTSSLSQCGLPRDESLRAVVYVQPGGSVASVGLSSASSLNPTVGICVVDQIRRWRLPDDSEHLVRSSFPLIAISRQGQSRSRAR